MNTTNGKERYPGQGPQPWSYPTRSPATTVTPHDEHEPESARHGGHGGQRGHKLMMIVCCLPMLAIVGLLVLTGVAGKGAIVSALLCTAMMAAMMFAMHGGQDHK